MRFRSFVTTLIATLVFIPVVVSLPIWNVGKMLAKKLPFEKPLQAFSGVHNTFRKNRHPEHSPVGLPSHPQVGMNIPNFYSCQY